MFEIGALVGLVVLGGILAAAATVVVLLFKLLFGLIVLPFKLAFVAIKFVIVGAIGLVLLAVAAPVAAGILLIVCLPLLVLGGLVWSIASFARAA